MKNGLIEDVNDQLHRDDGPVIEYYNGTKFWWLNGVQHREDGPAVEFVDGAKFWYKHGKLHREDGPAQDFITFKLWYYNGQHIACNTQEEFERLLKLKAFW